MTTKRKAAIEPMQKPNTNVEAIIRSIQTELFTAQEGGRNPSAQNALAIFRMNMQPKLSEEQSITLFDRVLTFIEDSGAPHD